MQIELDKKDIIALIKGLIGYQSYEKANELSKMGAGDLSGFPNERWDWNEWFFNARNEQELYEFYKLLKSWIK